MAVVGLVESFVAAKTVLTHPITTNEKRLACFDLSDLH